MRKYELFEMSDKETVMDMYTRFTHITNKLKLLRKSFTTEELVRKILRFLPQSRETKVTAIQEAKKMDEISLDELIGSLQTYELQKNSQVKKDHDLVRKALESEGLDLDDEEIAMVARMVTKLLKKAGWQLKKGSSSKARNNDRDKATCCFKCGKHDHVVKNYPFQNEV